MWKSEDAVSVWLRGTDLRLSALWIHCFISDCVNAVNKYTIPAFCHSRGILWGVFVTQINNMSWDDCLESVSVIAESMSRDTIIIVSNIYIYIYIYSEDEDYHICCIFAVVDLIASLCACLLQMSLLWGLLWYSLLCESPVHPETMVLLVSYISGCVYCCLLQGGTPVNSATASVFCLFVCQALWSMWRWQHEGSRVGIYDIWWFQTEMMLLNIMIIFQKRNTDLGKSLLRFLFRS